ncbi:MAG TPA: hypothetical protein VM867_04690 [Xanthobacteraceae bacterium]|jgi:hypothetical protein|nr:hypothetical protein [Xanthobacteraceae bacterium]
MYLVGIPLLVIPFVIYNIIEFVMPGSAPGTFWTHVVLRHRLASGAEWGLTASDVMLTVSLLILFAELVKATRLSSRSIVDHLLSTVLFVVMLLEFILFKEAATSTFFLLMMISFIDVIGGFSVSIRSAQRDFTVEGSNSINRM